MAARDSTPVTDSTVSDMMKHLDVARAAGQSKPKTETSTEREPIVAALNRHNPSSEGYFAPYDRPGAHLTACTIRCSTCEKAGTVEVAEMEYAGLTDASDREIVCEECAQ